MTEHWERIAEVLHLVAEARRHGWYEDDPGWTRVDQLLAELGYN